MMSEKENVRQGEIAKVAADIVFELETDRGQPG